MAFLTPLLLAAALVLCVPAGARAGVAAGDSMPAITVAEADGTIVEVDLATDGVVVIEFWASWCTACRQALPALARLAAERRSQGFRALAVSIDRTGAAAEDYLAKNLATERRALEVLFDPGGRAMAQLGAPGLPALYVVDHGTVRLVQGGWQADGEQRLRHLVDVLLQRQPSPPDGDPRQLSVASP